MKISRSAGELLRPHLGVLIPALLVATGEMEGKELNYYSTRLANDASIQVTDHPCRNRLTSNGLEVEVPLVVTIDLICAQIFPFGVSCERVIAHDFIKMQRA